MYHILYSSYENVCGARRHYPHNFTGAVFLALQLLFLNTASNVVGLYSTSNYSLRATEKASSNYLSFKSGTFRSMPSHI